jgi:RNA polymerase sigma-70 factor, ECF subfamily
MPTPEWLAEQFEQHRPHLRAVAYRMLGSASEAEDAVQEGWIRLGRTDVSAVENLRAWLTTVVGGCAWTCCGRGHRAGRSPWTCMCPIR